MNSEATLSDPAQPARPGLRRGSAQEKNNTLNPAFQLSGGKKASYWWELLGFRVTDKPCKFQKTHGFTWLQLFNHRHPEQTPLLRSWPFPPECFRWSCKWPQVYSTEPQPQKTTFQIKRDEKSPFSPMSISKLTHALTSTRKSVQFAAAYTRALLSQKIRCFASFILIPTLLSKQLL